MKGKKRNCLYNTGSSFCVIGNSDRISYYTKKPSGQERTAAQRNYVAMATAAGGESCKAGFFLLGITE